MKIFWLCVLSDIGFNWYHRYDRLFNVAGKLAPNIDLIFWNVIVKSIREIFLTSCYLSTPIILCMIACFILQFITMIFSLKSLSYMFAHINYTLSENYYSLGIVFWLFNSSYCIILGVVNIIACGEYASTYTRGTIDGKAVNLRTVDNSKYFDKLKNGW